MLWDKSDADDAVEAFTQALSRVTYEPGRHGASEQDWTPEQAQAVLGQAVTICEWIRLGIFTRAGSPPPDSDAGPAGPGERWGRLVGLRRRCN